MMNVLYLTQIEKLPPAFMKAVHLLLDFHEQQSEFSSSSKQRLFNMDKNSVRLVSDSPQSQLSYFHKATSLPIQYKTIRQLLDNTVDKCGDKEAVVSCYQNIRKTFNELKQDVDNLATGLLALGLKPGDRVAFWGPNSYEYVLSQYALGKVGMIQVCLNPSYQARELEQCLAKVSVKCLISADSFRNNDLYKILCQVIPSLPEQKKSETSCDRLPEFKTVIMLSDKQLPGTWKFSDVMKIGNSDNKKSMYSVASEVQPEQPFIIMFTSGTTGSPKAACISQFSAISNSYFFGMRMGFDIEPQKLCVPLPLFHVFAVGAGTMASLIFGLTAVYPTPMFNALEAIKAIHNERCSVIYGTTTMYLDLLHHPDFPKYDVSSIKFVIAGGSLCPPEVAREIGKELCDNIIIGYGCTECSMAISISSPTDSFEKRTTTVGCVLDHAEIKVVDRDGRVVKFGEAGELLARGYQVMNGYWNDERRTREAFFPGKWYRTGDLVTVDEEGYITIIGRSKDLIIRGGENIYPNEIEDFLHTHPEVAEVQVVGVPDRRLGEEVCAWIKLHPGASVSKEDIKSFCKGKIATFKIPTYCLFVEDFPKTMTGKIQKYVLREESIKKLNLK